MKYILDARFFILSRDYYPEVFPTFWESIDSVVENGIASSVDEVYGELKQYGGEQDHLINWAKRNKRIFTKPTLDEQGNVGKIFTIPEFRRIMTRQKQLRGGPFADPFVIAKAIATGGIVVTGELPTNKGKKGTTQGSPKIPDICKHFGVECITPEECMKRLDWRF